VLCFVDEVLRGTNTIERIAASTQILEKLSTSGVICFAATHDIELTHLLEDKYDNYHFREEVSGGDIIFPYQLLQGRAQTRNAIKLLEIIGFSEDVINNADEMARNFLDKGEWNNVC
jgi:DNA mismatch repair ATPase MutS